MSDYRPRRQSATRYLDGDCPAGVLAIYDNGGKTLDRYTVFYMPSSEDLAADGRGAYVGYRGMSEHPASAQGFGIYGEMQAYEVARYRYRASKEACKWSDLPADVQAIVRADCAE